MWSRLCSGVCVCVYVCVRNLSVRLADADQMFFPIAFRPLTLFLSSTSFLPSFTFSPKQCRNKNVQYIYMHNVYKGRNLILRQINNSVSNRKQTDAYCLCFATIFSSRTHTHTHTQYLKGTHR